REALAAALYTEQQHAARRLESRGAAVEGGLAGFHPAAQVRQPADVGEARGVWLEVERAVAVQQLVLAGLHGGEILGRDGAVVIEHASHEPLGVGGREAGEVVDDPRERRAVDLRRAPLVLALP